MVTTANGEVKRDWLAVVSALVGLISTVLAFGNYFDGDVMRACFWLLVAIGTTVERIGRGK